MPCAEEGGAAMPSTRASPRSDEQLAAPWITWFPLTVAGAPVGAIVGRSATRPDFEHERVEGATLFAQHTAALLDVSPAVTDSLTGLLNRRGFDERLSDEIERAFRADTGLTLVLADCDDLKAINDRGGHELGDRVLEALARCLESCKRAEDAAARIGGVRRRDARSDGGVGSRLRAAAANGAAHAVLPRRASRRRSASRRSRAMDGRPTTCSARRTVRSTRRSRTARRAPTRRDAS